MSAPGNSFVSCVRNLRRFGSDPIPFMREMNARYGDIVRLWLGPKQFFFLFSPHHARHILQTHQKKYRHSRLIFDKIIPLTGPKGLVQMEGETWKKHRRMTNMSMKPDQIRTFVAPIAKITEDAFPLLDRHAASGEPLDMMEFITHLVLKTAAGVLFGIEGEDTIQRMAKAFLEANRCCGNRIQSVVSFPEWVPSPQNVRLHRAVKILADIVHATIAERKTTDSSRHQDMLSMMLNVRDEDGATLADEQIHNHMVTFLFAGHETTACSLAWTFYLIAQYPAIEAAIRAEAREIFSGEPPTFDQVERLIYTTMTYQESLRLYPPAWILARQPVEQDEIDGHTIPRHATLLLSIWEIHRHPKFWDNPAAFDPERFRPPRSHHNTFFPFGAGPRICSGLALTMMEAPLILALILRHYRFTIVPEHPIEVETTITTRPRYGIRMKVDKLD